MSDINSHNSFFNNNKFIDLFKNNSSVNYFTSHFVVTNSYAYENNEKEILYDLEPLFYNINNKRLSYILELESTMNEMYHHIKEYKLSIGWILNNNPLDKPYNYC